MKIKQDFVTNSSSTSFMFSFKGDKLDLFKSLLNHKEKFDLNFDSYDGTHASIDVWDVIRSMDSVIRTYNDELWIHPTIQNIDEKIKMLEKDINEFSEKEKEDEWYMEYNNDIRRVVKKLKECKEKGLTSYLEIGFGDNHGVISGQGIGSIMDYEGRDIEIDSDDLVLLTEQDR